MLPEEPGLRPVTLNRALLLSSSDRATVPAVQLFVGLAVVAENAEYEACQTRAALPIRPTATTPTPAMRAALRDGRRGVLTDMTGAPEGG